MRSGESTKIAGGKESLCHQRIELATKSSSKPQAFWVYLIGRAGEACSADEPTISAEMPDEALVVATNLAQPCEVEMSIGMRRVEFYATLISRFGSIVAFKLFEYDRAIEVQQRVLGKVLKRIFKNGQCFIAARLCLA